MPHPPGRVRVAGPVFGQMPRLCALQLLWSDGIDTPARTRYTRVVPSSSPYLAGSDITGLARALRRRQISSVELTSWTLERLGRIAPRLNGLAARTPERALAEARRADARIAAGAQQPLVGIPYGAKDLIGAEDGRAMQARDAVTIARLRRVGAVLTAKLAVENAGGGWAGLAAVTMNGGDGRRAEAAAAGPFGFGVNPWDVTRWSGGSSSGPAIAVAAGLLPYALGTETAGSVVGPAAFCGLSAVRPTFGVLSLVGVVPLAWTLDKVGVLAHSVNDCAAVFGALVGGAAGRAPLDSTLLRRSRRARLRLGFAEEDLASAAEPARRALARGIAELRGLGPRFDHLAIPARPYGSLVDTVMRAEGTTTFHDLIASDRFASLVTPQQRVGIELGLRLPAHAYLRAMQERERIREDFEAIFAQCDVLVAPAQPRTAPPLAELTARTSGSAPPPEGLLRGNGAINAAGNLAGLPAVVIPCGLGTDGLPVGLQLVGPPHSEPLLLGLAAAYQRETDHHLRRAPLVSEG